MSDPVQIRGDSPRWSRYDLVNGVVVPAKDAVLGSYDPWESFRENVDRYRTVEQPYAALLELSRNLKDLESQNIRPTHTGFHPRHLPDPIIGPRTEADELILTWCNRHGLLGLVPVLANSITLPVVVTPEYDLIRDVEWRHHFRDGGIWHSSKNMTRVWGSTPKEAAASAREAAEKAPKPGVAWINLRTHFFEEKPLDHIELFFRPVWKDEPLIVPSPNTRGFWEVYGEPVQDLLEWCEIFSRSVGYMSTWKGDGNDEQMSHAFLQAQWALSGLSNGAAPAFLVDPQTKVLTEERVAAGLLASYALMFMWDYKAGRRALECQNCKRYFVSNERQAQYCSPRCRNTAQGRRYRSKLKVSYTGGGYTGGGYQGGGYTR